jgi:hypothetical protein
VEDDPPQQPRRRRIPTIATMLAAKGLQVPKKSPQLPVATGSEATGSTCRLQGRARHHLWQSEQ